MSKSLVKVGLVMCIGVFLVACTTKGHVANQIVDSMKKEWGHPPIKTNHEAKSFSYYLPSTYKVQSTGQSNIIFRDHSGHLYILFVNGNEGPKSQVNYKNDQNALNKSDVHQTMSDTHSFSYVIIRKLEKDQYELIVDRGGVKVSTKASLAELTKLAPNMEKIVHSVTLH